MKYYHDITSSLIKEVAYDRDTSELWVYFHKQDWQYDCVYTNVPEVAFEDLINAKSVGNFYLKNIKPVFKTKKSNFMAKKSDKIINLKIDVTKINKDWLFQGDKGIYLDLTLFYREEPDDYKTNGMIVQSVPKKVYEKDRQAQGPILGNCKDWATQKQERVAEAQPGVESGHMAGDSITEPEWVDDLPF